MFIRFDVIHERDGQTDERTDERTLHDSKDRAYASHRAVKTVSLVVVVSGNRTVKLNPNHNLTVQSTKVPVFTLLSN